MLDKTENEALSPFRLFTVTNWSYCHEWIFRISVYGQEEILFMLSFVYSTVKRGDIREYKAHLHMNFH